MIYWAVCCFLLQGVALTKVPKIKFLIIIGGAMFKSPSVAEKAYDSPIECPSLHFLGILSPFTVSFYQYRVPYLLPLLL
jgi:hypothetical protein